MSESAAERLEAELVDAVLSAPAGELRNEPDVGHLLWRAEQREPQRTGERLAELIEEPVLLVRWLSQSMIERRSEAGLSYLLPWPTLVENLDADVLRAAIGHLDPDRLGVDATEREREAVRQALHYSAHPGQAAEDLRALTGDAAEDEP